MEVDALSFVQAKILEISPAAVTFLQVFCNFPYRIFDRKVSQISKNSFSVKFTCLVLTGCVAAPSQTELLKIGYKQSRTREWQKS